MPLPQIYPPVLPRYTPATWLPKNIKNPDATGSTYKSAFLKVSAATAAASGATGTSKDTRAPRLDLAITYRALELCDNTNGLVHSQLVCVWRGKFVAISAMEVDHFHPVNGAEGFATKLAALNTALEENGPEAIAWVAALKTAYPEAGEQELKWFHVINEYDDGSHFITPYFWSTTYNDMNNLWLITGEDNTALQNKLKLPSNGGKVTDCELFGNKWFGNDFLAKLGTIDKGKFTDQHLDRSRLTVYATTDFDANWETKALPDSKRIGLATIALRWFHYRYTVANSFGKTLGVFKHALQEFTQGALARVAEIEEADSAAAGTAKSQAAKEQKLKADLAKLVLDLPVELKAMLQGVLDDEK